MIRNKYQISPRMLQRLSLIASLMLMFLVGTSLQTAHALTLSSSDGVWISATGVDGSDPHCLFINNTVPTDDQNLLTYGSAVSSGRCPSAPMPEIQSGFGFRGNTTLNFEPDTVFLLGEFTHFNNPLYAFNNMDFAILRLDLNFIDPNITTQLDYRVLLDETPNFQSVCPYGDMEPCADRVDFEPASENQTFVIGGITYILEVIGFVPGELESCTFDDANVIDGLISDEQQSNSACLFARFFVPEPELTITKTGTVGPVAVNTLVNYQIVVTNTGNIPLTNVTVDDPILGLTRSLGQLDIEESVTIDASYTVQASDLPGPLVNFATADSAETDEVADRHSIDLLSLGSISVDKLVDWNDTIPNQTQLFEICLTGPSYPSGDCEIVDFDGGTLVWDDLEAGQYTVSEVPPGQDWSITNQTSNITLVAGADESVTIINQYDAPGSLSVIKNVVWNDAPIDESVIFSICAQGPSYPTPACQTIGASGGTLVWQNLLPGVYTVTETPPANWSVEGSGVQVTVPMGGNGATTLTNTYTFVPPPPPEQCEDPDPQRDLVGVLLPETGFSTGRVINNSEVCSYEIGIASYLKYDEIVDNQILYSDTPGSIGPGQTVEISVAMPECAVQVDLFYGPVLQSLFEARYGERLLAYMHLPGTGYCVTD